MVLTADSAWYVIRTKQYKEQVVVQSASSFVEDIYLPLFRTKRRALGRLIDRTEPLFPCYIFARFRLEEAYYKLTRSVGVVGLIRLGGEPCAVDAQTIQDIRSRETDGLIVLNPKRLQPRERVTIREGCLRGIEAVFQRYLSGAERVALLLESIGQGNIRAIVKASTVAATTWSLRV